jgi:hypothetical protein
MWVRESPKAKPSFDPGLMISGGFAQGKFPLIEFIGYRNRE